MCTFSHDNFCKYSVFSENDTFYVVSLVVRNEHGVSNLVEDQFQTSDEPQPATPTDLMANNTMATKVHLTWKQPSSNIAYYTVRYYRWFNRKNSREPIIRTLRRYVSFCHDLCIWELDFFLSSHILVFYYKIVQPNRTKLGRDDRWKRKKGLCKWSWYSIGWEGLLGDLKGKNI